jgi:hypothetical protein
MDCACAKTAPGRLTQENHVSRLALLNLALTCGNPLGTVHRRTADQEEYPPLKAAKEQQPEGFTAMKLEEFNLGKRSVEAPG